ncbi:MAG TPA: GNAT family N-acetyltransferase [Rhabdochlamydiaceae bacterium]|nr:GNAT family N-acetyltransferase [Rhabdochlamydiaceae bacterium]
MKFRQATIHDLPEIIRLLFEDELGKEREQGKSTGSYQSAFEEIKVDPNQALMVVEENGKVIGTCHLTFMPSLTFHGSKRMNIEAVRIDSAFRSRGVGEWMVQQALKMAQEKGCKIVQLTTNKKRKRAKEFYEKLGFKDTHEGMKLHL